MNTTRSIRALAHALLHQASRERDAEGRVVARLEDYACVRELVADLAAKGVEATVPETIRETVEAVKSLAEKSEEKGFTTNKAVAEKLGIDKAAALRRVRVAISRGYLENLEDRKGRPAQLTIGETTSEDREVLPNPEDLKEAMNGCTVDPVLGDETLHSPSKLPAEQNGRGAIPPPKPHQPETSSSEEV